MNVLVIEDEKKVSAFIKNGLEEQGHLVDVAVDGMAGEMLAMSKHYDIILMDLILPKVNGLDLCRKIKSVKPEIPIMMLTALGTTDDKLIGFDAGADDYLIKPFEFKELVARIRALTKRAALKPPSQPIDAILKAGDLQLDLERKVAIRGEKLIPLTAKEFGLLSLLLENKGKVVSKLEIGDRVWDSSFDLEINVVEVYINILRKKIDKEFEQKLIQTRIGMGYVIEG